MYLKRLFIVLIITGAIAFATGSLFDHFYKQRWSALFFEKTDTLIKGKNNYDIIFLGNSRVHFGINPFYIDSVTKLNSYNFGTGAADAQDILLTSELYCQQHSAAKLAVISLDMGALTINETLKTRFHYLFYLDNDTMSRYMKQTGFLTPLIKVLPFTKYSFFDEYNRTSLFVKGKQFPAFDHNIYKGFLNIHPDKNSTAIGLYNIKATSDSLWEPAIDYFRNAIVALQQKGTMVVFVSPPEKSNSANKKNNFKKIADSIFIKIAADHHLKYFHFENDTDFTDDYFVDDIHLNGPGTKIYSIQLADSINSILH